MVQPAANRFLVESLVGAANGVAGLGADAKVPAGQLPDLSGIYAPLTAGGKGVVRRDELFFNVKNYGATGDGATDDATAIRAAIAAAFAVGGGVVFFPPGTYMVGSTLTFPMNPTTRYSNITLRGAGPNTTTLRRTGNFILLDISGLNTTQWIISAAVEDLKLIGAGNPLWVQPVVRSYYSQFLSFTRVNWDNSRSTALDCVQIFDSYFYECRWDYQGNETATGWPVWIRCADQGAATGWGSSTDNSNNCWFINCVMEQCRGGGIYLDGRAYDGTSQGARQVNRIYFINFKYENAVATISAPALKMVNCNHIVWQNGHASAQNLNPVNAGARVNLVEIKDTLASQIVNVSLNALTGVSTPSVRAGISYQGGNTLCSIANVDSSSQTDHSPSVALVEYAGTNTLMNEERTGYYYNPAGAPLFVGAPTTLARPKRSIAKNNNLLAWAYDIAMLSGSTQILTSGALALVKVPVDDLMTVSAVAVLTSAAGAGLTSAYAAVYSSTGVLLGLSADVSAALMGAAGLKSLPVTAQPGKSLTLAAGDGVFVYVAIIASGTTPPTLYRLGNVAPNANLTAASLRFANGPTGITTPPANVTTSAFTSGNPIWVGLT